MVVRKLKTKHFLFPHPFPQVSTQISEHTDCERSLYAVLERKCCALFILFFYTIANGIVSLNSVSHSLLLIYRK